MPPAVSSYSAEAHLQEVLALQPSLVPGVGTNPVAVRELQTGSGPLDLVVIDADGGLTLVECKLASNAEIRREIVGQVFDYASSLWRMSFDELDQRWRQRSQTAEGILETLDVEGDDASELIETIEQRLAKGQFNIVLAVDVINAGLRRIVEFLNDRTADDVSVVALQLQYAKHDGVEILVPAVYGSELAQVKAAKAEDHQIWSEDDVMSYLKSHWPASVKPVAALVEAARALPGYLFVGTKATTPSMIARWETTAGVVWPFAIYTSAQPRVQVNFHWMKALPASVKLELASALSGIAGSGIDVAAIESSGFNRKPSIFVESALIDAGACQQLIGAFVAASTALS